MFRQLFKGWRAKNEVVGKGKTYNVGRIGKSNNIVYLQGLKKSIRFKTAISSDLNYTCKHLILASAYSYLDF